MREHTIRDAGSQSACVYLFGWFCVPYNINPIILRELAAAARGSYVAGTRNPYPPILYYLPFGYDIYQRCHVTL